MGRKVLKADKSNVDATFLRGRIFKHLGQVDVAQSYFWFLFCLW